MNRVQLLTDVARALNECFPDRAEGMIRAVEARFRDPDVPPPGAERQPPIVLLAGGDVAWSERSDNGLAYEFIRTMRRLAEAGYRGDVRVVIEAAKE
ncbi:MAG TPA: hypothetical protein VMV18_02405 [bacterium]|nr:hypothetical protein [bacterium]